MILGGSQVMDEGNDDRPSAACLPPLPPSPPRVLVKEGGMEVLVLNVDIEILR
jgi:hypothetical protein